MTRDIKEDQTSSAHFSVNVADQIHQCTEESSPNDADVILAETSEGAAWTKIRIPVSALGGSGGATYNTIYADTYEVTESGTSAVTKKTFSYVNDSDAPATNLKLIVGLWCEGGGTATCTFEIDDGSSPVSDTVTSTASAEEDIKKITLSLSTVDQDATVTVNIKLHRTSGTVAHLKYTEVKELFY